LTPRRRQHEAAQQVVRDGLSVRSTETLVRQLQEAAAAPVVGKKSAAKQQDDPNILSLQQDLTERLGAKVLIQQGAGGKGQLVISYHSLDELEGILAHLR
jgi:ParB family chromosome partitioning protein